MFDVAAEAYDAFMGRYSGPLAPLFCDFAAIEDGSRVLDVGCGPGALVAELVGRHGASAVTAVDPSEPFVEAARARNEGVDVRRGSAEQLPFADDAFDAALAQLVVHFMDDPLQGLREMARVTRPGGRVAACVWDHGGGQGPLSPFWDAARELDPDVHGESRLAGARKGHLTELFADAGMRDATETLLCVRVEHATFEEWWKPFTFGVGPLGTYLASLDEAHRERLRERCRERLGGSGNHLTAREAAAGLQPDAGWKTAAMHEVRPGVWHWQSPHPDWEEEQWWPELVSSYGIELGDDVVLFDPLAVPDELRERATAVVLTAPYHERDARGLGLPVHTPPADTWQDWVQKFGVDPDRVRGMESEDLAWLRAGEGEGYFHGPGPWPFGITAHAGREDNDLILWLPSIGAIVTGDSLSDFGDGLGIQLGGRTHVTRDQVAERLRALLDLPVELVLPAHGEPTDRAALERALS